MSWNVSVGGLPLEDDTKDADGKPAGKPFADRLAAIAAEQFAASKPTGGAAQVQSAQVDAAVKIASEAVEALVGSHPAPGKYSPAKPKSVAVVMSGHGASDGDARGASLSIQVRLEA